MKISYAIPVCNEHIELEKLLIPRLIPRRFKMSNNLKQEQDKLCVPNYGDLPSYNMLNSCLLDTYNECGIEEFAETFSIMMNKYHSSQVEEGLLPTLPLVLTDGNLRSFKEYHEDVGWKTTHSNSSIDKMIDISNEQIYETEKTKVFISQKERKKVHNRIKKDNSISYKEEIKKKYEEENKKKHENPKENIENEENEEEIENDNEEEIENDNEESDDENINNSILKEYDYSIIDDDFIEKYSKSEIMFDK